MDVRKMFSDKNKETVSPKLKNSTIEDDEEEKDTELEESCDMSDIAELLFPKTPGASNILGCLKFSKFSFVIENRAFEAWVKQPSPCCAAASVAGALNIINNRQRSDDQALDYVDVLSIYKEIIEERAIGKKRKLERILSASFTPFEESVQIKCDQANKSFGGKHERKLSKGFLMNVVEDLFAHTQMHDEEIFKEIQLLQDLESSTLGEEPDGLDVNVENNVDLDETTSVVTTRSVVSLICSYFHDKDGLEKLNRDKPSTAICGNWILLKVVGRMKALGKVSNCRSSQLLGRKSKSFRGKISISRNDSGDKITEQWQLLWSAFSRDSTAIIYHLKNHYALIFAMREWVETEKIDTENKSCSEYDNYESTYSPTIVREILTARKGQRPTVWISWDEIRETVLKWNGYGMMYFEKFQTNKN